MKRELEILSDLGSSRKEIESISSEYVLPKKIQLVRLWCRKCRKWYVINSRVEYCPDCDSRMLQRPPRKKAIK